MKNFQIVFISMVWSSTIFSAEDTQLSESDKQLQKNYPLHYAARTNNYKEALELITTNSDVNSKPYWLGKTPLHLAAESDSFEVAKLLLEKNADINRIDSYGYTPIQTAAYWNSNAVAELLIQKKALLNTQEPTYGYTPLHTSLYYGRNAITKSLIQAGADVNIKNYRNETPLFYACQPKYINPGAIFLAIAIPFPFMFLVNSAPLEQKVIIETLLKAGADVNIIDRDQKSPLFYALDNDFYTSVSLLLDANATTECLNQELLEKLNTYKKTRAYKKILSKQTKAKSLKGKSQSRKK